MGRPDLPSGSVTFLFTDIEGSTKLLHELGPDAYAAALDEHRRSLRDAFTARGGAEVDTQGDAFFYAFPDAALAVEAAEAGQHALAAGRIRVRMGVHTGTPLLTEEGYIGEDVNKGARIAAAAHGGQVLLSKDTRDEITAPVVDLGLHRLKDLEDPVWIFQLGADRFPPLKTLSNTNLPQPATPLVGRVQERSDIEALLRGTARLVTLTGPGGTGKTRLAFEVAAELVPEFRNGVFWLDLSRLRDHALVAEAISQALGASVALSDHIGQAEMLVFLDNFEQVIDAAPLLADLLGECPNLRLLITSRERLNIAGEVEYPVPPLEQDDAVALFAARSGLGPDPAIAELCRRLDDLPLAIELAAARTKVLTPAQILERIGKRLDLLRGGRDAEPRQATLRATIDWSHSLLSEEEKELFARLAIFAGGWTLDAAEIVADADIDVLQSLIERSLVRRVKDRMGMLETIREFAAERLDESGEASELGRRHAEYFLALAERRGSEASHYDKEALDEIEAELDNSRVAIDRLVEQGEAELLQRFVTALANPWSIRGYLSEGHRISQTVLQMDRQPSPSRAKALLWASDLAYSAGELELAEEQANEALELFRDLGDASSAGEALTLLAEFAASSDDFTSARRRAEEAAEIFERENRPFELLMAQRLLVWFLRSLGEVEEATAMCDRGLEAARRFGNPHTLTQFLEARAEIFNDEGRARDAARLLAEAYELHSSVEDRYRLVLLLFRFGRLLVLDGKLESAAAVLGAHLTLTDEAGARIAWVEKEREIAMQQVRAQLDPEVFEQAWARGASMSVEAAVELSLRSLGVDGSP